MTYPSFIAIGAEGNQNFGETVTLPYPTSTAPVTGNLVIGVIVNANGDFAFTWPSGWTPIASDANSRLSTSIAWHIYTSGDAAPAVTITSNSSYHGYLLTFQGFYTSEPINTANVLTLDNGTTGAASPTAINGGGQVTQGTQSLILDVAAAIGTNDAATPTGQGYANVAGPAGNFLISSIEETGGATTPTYSYNMNSTSTYWQVFQLEILSQALPPPTITADPVVTTLKSPTQIVEAVIATLEATISTKLKTITQDFAATETNIPESAAITINLKTITQDFAAVETNIPGAPTQRIGSRRIFIMT